MTVRGVNGKRMPGISNKQERERERGGEDFTDEPV